MYESYWNLKKKPFEIGCDPEFYYPAPGHQAVLLKLRYILETRRGNGLLLGENGMGKSLLVTMLTELRRKGSMIGPFVEVNMPQFTSQDILFYLAEKLESLPAPAPKIPGLPERVAGSEDQPPVYKAFSAIERVLKRLASEKQKPILVIEGADRITDPEVWSALSSLTEAEYQGMPLLTLLLTAAPKKLTRPIPFVEEILEAAAELRPLDEDETAEYVYHRLQIAGADRHEIFTPHGLEAVYRLTGGIPRKINRLGDVALLVGFAEQLSKIDDEVIINLNNELIPS
ncbi:MAG: ExeA family protein [Thermoguttaceae bacterium]|jgi:type II secretory pathway predicted ATPase ExeA